MPLTSAVLALLLGLAPQDPANPAAETSPAPGRRDAIEDAARDLTDHVMGIAGDEVVLQRDLTLVLYSEAFRERFERTRPGTQAYQTLVEEALQVRLQTLITVQAGRTLGFDPELIESFTDDNFKGDVEAFGGTKVFSERLKRSYLTPQDYRNQLRDSLIGNAWRSAVSGRAPGPTGRASVDRDVSPGALYAAYEDFQRSPSPADRELVGIQPERVRLRQLVISVDQVPDARELAAAIREQAEQGEDFGGLIRMHGSAFRESEGLTGLVPLEDLREASKALHGDAELYEFARTAPLGAFVGPLEGSNDAGRKGFFVYRLEERAPATEALPFHDPQMQRRLRRRVQLQLDEMRIGKAFEDYLRQTFVYPGELREVLRSGRGLRGR